MSRRSKKLWTVSGESSLGAKATLSVRNALDRESSRRSSLSQAHENGASCDPELVGSVRGRPIFLKPSGSDTKTQSRASGFKPGRVVAVRRKPGGVEVGVLTWARTAAEFGEAQARLAAAGFVVPDEPISAECENCGGSGLICGDCGCDPDKCICGLERRDNFLACGECR